MRDPRTHDIIDAAVQIHMRLGPGLLERVYEDILAHELVRRNHRVDRQLSFDLRWNEALVVQNAYRCDLLVDRAVLVEVKAVVELHPVHKRQLNTYLTCAEKELGLLLNFGGVRMRDGIHRLVRSSESTRLT